MKQLITLLLIGGFMPLFAQSVITGEAIMPEGDKVIASTVTPDNHYYVLTGPIAISTVNGKEVSNKITLFHFDEHMKLVLQKEMKPLKYDKSKFDALTLFAVGDKLLLVGKAEFLDKEIRKIGYSVIDKTTLLPDPNIVPIVEHPTMSWFGGGDGQYDFRQNAPGKGFAMMISYAEGKPDAQGRTTISRSTEYVMVDDKLQVHIVLTFLNSNRPTDTRPNGFYLASNGFLYIGVMEHDHVDLKDGWWEDEKELAKLAKIESVSKFYKYDPTTKTKKKSEMKFSDPNFLCTQILIFEGSDGVYVGGFTSDENYRERKRLIHDTASLAKDAQYYFFAQKLNDNNPLTVDLTSCAKVDASWYNEAFKNSNISEQDRNMGVRDGVSLDCAVQLADGKFVFGGGSYSDWSWPPYEKIKNDKDYTLEKDEEGNVRRISGPSWETTRKYWKLFTVTFDPAKKEVTTSALSVSIERGMGAHSSKSQNDLFLCYSFSASAEGINFYYAESVEGNPTGEISKWKGTGAASAVKFQHEDDANIAPSSTVIQKSNYALMTGKKKLYLLKL